MDYKKKYEEAFAIIKAYYNRTQFSSIHNSEEEKETLERAFPELKEGEEETTRKELFNFLAGLSNNPHTQIVVPAKFFYWIKKQKEQKPVNPTMIEKERIDNAFTKMMLKEQKLAKVEPKFKVGDKVYALGNRFECTIESIDETTYYGDTTNFDIKDQDNWELAEVKSAEWSEEDENILDSIISDIQLRIEAVENEPTTEMYAHLLWRQFNWLKSLKQRIGGKL